MYQTPPSYALFYLSHKNPMSVYPSVGATCFKAYTKKEKRKKVTLYLLKVT